jgi:hypothetical protein
MLRSLLLPAIACAILSLGSSLCAGDEAKPAREILNVTDYRGLAGPLTEFKLKDDRTWTKTVTKNGQKVELKSGKLSQDESKALLEFVQRLYLAKHTRKRNVEDAAMVSVTLGQVDFLDLAPPIAAKVIDRIGEVAQPKRD